MTSRVATRRLPTAARLWLAALLSLVPLGLVWSATAGFLTLAYYNPGTCDYAEPGTYCTPESYTPGTYVPGTTLHGFSTAPRIFLVAAFVALLVCAVSTRTAGTLRLARTACGCLAAGAAFAIGYRSAGSAVALTAALALVLPVVRRPVLAPGAPAR